MKGCPVNQFHLFCPVHGKRHDVCLHCGAVMLDGVIHAPSRKKLLTLAEKHPRVFRTKKGWLWLKGGSKRKVSEQDVLALAGSINVAMVEPRLADPSPETEWEKIVFGEHHAENRAAKAEA